MSQTQTCCRRRRRRRRERSKLWSLFRDQVGVVSPGAESSEEAEHDEGSRRGTASSDGTARQGRFQPASG
jgi:hypothetical protein